MNNNVGFKDIFHFAKLCGKLANKKSIESLVKSGSFDNLHKNRNALCDNIDSIVKYANDYSKANGKTSQDFLFGESEVINVALPKIDNLNQDISQNNKMVMEFDAVGFYLTFHPLDNYREKLLKANIIDSGELEDLLSDGNSRKINMAGVITKIVQRFSKKGRFAFVHIADLSGIYETMIFSDDLISKRRDLLVEGNVIIVNISAKKEDESATRMMVNDIFQLEITIDKVEMLTELTVKNNKFSDKKTKKEVNQIEELDISDIIEYSEMKKKDINLATDKDTQIDTKNAISLLKKINIGNSNVVTIPVLTKTQMELIYDTFKKIIPDEINGIGVILNFSKSSIRLKKKYLFSDLESLLKLL